MKILALDTSSIVASVAVMDDDKLIGEYSINHKRTHSQTIMPMIDQVLKSCELTVKDMDAIAVANGPGSFTGLRIGVATARGLAHAMNLPVVGVSTLDALAMNIPYTKGLICPILDARRSQVYTAVYEWSQQSLQMVMKHLAISIEELVDKLLKRPESVTFLGDGVAVNREYLEEKLKDRAVFAPQNVCMQKASSVAQIAMQKVKEGDVSSFYDLIPTYLRKSEAERQYEAKMKRCETDECHQN